VNRDRFLHETPLDLITTISNRIGLLTVNQYISVAIIDLSESRLKHLVNLWIFIFVLDLPTALFDALVNGSLA